MATRKRPPGKKDRGEKSDRANTNRPNPARRGNRQRPSAERAKHAARPAVGPDFLYGWHTVLAALRNPARRCHELLLTAETERALVTTAEGRPLPRHQVMDRVALDRRLKGAVHQGIAALVDPLPRPSLAEVIGAPEPGSSTALIVLDHVTDPHNVGAVLRSAAAFGARGVICADRHAPPPTAALAKAASGALETVPLVYVPNLVRALALLAESGYWRVGLDGAAPGSVATARRLGALAIVLGAEGHGLRRLTAETCDVLVRIPTDPAMPSLNVSNAAAVALFALIGER